MRSYFAFVERQRHLLPRPSDDALPATNGVGEGAAAVAWADGGDLGPRLIPGATSIRHAPYGTPWDSATPLVLTGDRAATGWPAAGWGWEYWEREHGAQFVTCKQRAPIFDDDQTSDTLIVESTLREALHYARTAHASAAAARGDAPVLYMNGWDVFEALPHLWHEEMDQLPGTTTPLTVAEYTRLHARFGLDTTTAITHRARGLCKLFVGPVGAITRIHQDNHEAHAWLCNIRGRKLYVLCRPQDSHKVAPPRSLSKGRGTRYSGRLDPLDPRDQQRARESGLELFATVLEPGQTIVAPSGWWHYAVSLTPTITLMCNFWDRANLHGLHDCFYLHVARAMDAASRDSRESPQAVTTPRPPAKATAARADEPVVPLAAPAAYVATHAPFVFIRESPATTAPMLGILRPGQSLLMGAAQDGWLRSAEPYDKGRYGWALEDGSPLGMRRLMLRADLYEQVKQHSQSSPSQAA